MEILPAIIPKTLNDLKDKVNDVASYVSEVHVDFCDGKYVPSESWPFIFNWNDFDKLEGEDEGLPHWEKIDYEADLMVDNPKEVMERLLKAGFSSFIIHAEGLKDSFEEIINLATDSDAKIGIAFLPQTDMSRFGEWIEKADFIQCMGISRIGYQGQSFEELVFDQIKKAKKLKEIVAVDGHVDLDTIGELFDAGATKFVVGSALWNAESIPQALHELKQVIH